MVLLDDCALPVVRQRGGTHRYKAARAAKFRAITAFSSRLKWKEIVRRSAGACVVYPTTNDRQSCHFEALFQLKTAQWKHMSV